MVARVSCKALHAYVSGTSHIAGVTAGLTCVPAPRSPLHSHVTDKCILLYICDTSEGCLLPQPSCAQVCTYAVYNCVGLLRALQVLSIGLGVGLAAVLGMLKFMYNLPLKGLIAAALLPTVGAACWMQWWVAAIGRVTSSQ